MVPGIYDAAPHMFPYSTTVKPYVSSMYDAERSGSGDVRLGAVSSVHRSQVSLVTVQFAT